jgi:hypothetical protein
MLPVNQDVIVGMVTALRIVATADGQDGVSISPNSRWRRRQRTKANKEHGAD